MQLSRRSRNKWADFCSAHGTLPLIEDAYAAHDVLLPPQWGPPFGSQRRALVAAAEETVDLADTGVQQRLLATYLDGIEDWGQTTATFMPLDYDDVLVPEARALVRSLQRDGAPIADDGTLVLGASAPQLAVERFDRLGEPRVLLEHLARIEAGIAADPAAAIASAKELRLSRDAVPQSARGSAAAQRVLQNLMTAVQGLAELRNELGLGHGRTAPSPALARHARLAANSARAVVEFVLETWHSRKDVEGGG
jgi:hypothetical protein